MELSKVQHIIQNPDSLNQYAIDDIAQLIESYPYCQTLHLIYQKRLQLGDDADLYKHSLAKTACYASDPSQLFYWLTEIDNSKSLLSNIVLEEDEESESTSQTSISDHAISSDHTFGYWLKLAINREMTIEDQLDKTSTAKQSALIDEFLQKNPTISPNKEHIKGKNTNLATKSTQESDSLMTETLAQIYLDQGLYNKAIKAYEILSLKNPQKSSFFAQRIAQIAELKK